MAYVKTLFYKNKTRAALFAWATGAGGTITLTPSCFSNDFVMVRNGEGTEIWGRWGQPIELKEAGVWELELNPTGSGSPITFAIDADGEAYPFVIPGPGLVPSHFPSPEPALLFPAGEETEVWADVPEELPLVGVGSWLSGLDPANRCGSVTFPDGDERKLAWMCLPVERMFYHMSDIAVSGRGGWWTLRLPAAGHPVRLTVWEGLPLFLRRPPQRLPYGRLVCTAAAEEDGLAMDARFTVHSFGRMIAQRDALKGETAAIPVLPGPYVVRVSRGIEFASAEKAVAVRGGGEAELAFRLARVLKPQAGWVCGDHHMHSNFFDGAQSPEAVARAARTNGLSYIFLTDDRPQALLDAGLQRHNDSGFLAMPGTEMMFRGVHMNALNARSYVGKTGDDPAHIDAWMRGIKATGTEEHPLALLLNHPSHIARVQPRQPYFRSWWVADRLGGVDLTENFDFVTWFDRLNQGVRLPGLWTTDAHDMAFLPPGKKGTYVYVGDELTEAAVIRGLTEGRSFNTRFPGAMLYLQVNGATIGDTAACGEDGRLDVGIRCETARPLKAVELIADGHVVRRWSCRHSLRFEAEAELRIAAKWMIARAYAYEEDDCWPEDDTAMEPLLESGCIAFTNPVWIAPPSREEAR